MDLGLASRIKGKVNNMRTIKIFAAKVNTIKTAEAEASILTIKTTERQDGRDEYEANRPMEQPPLPSQPQHPFHGEKGALPDMTGTPFPLPIFVPPGMATPPQFSANHPALTGAGVSMLSPDMEWVQCNLPAFVWFELFVRAGAVLSAAAVGAAGPSSFYGWNGEVGVVAPKMFFEAIRNASLIPFQSPDSVQTTPLAPTTSSEEPKSASNTAEKSDSNVNDAENKASKQQSFTNDASKDTNSSSTSSATQGKPGSTSSAYVPPSQRGKGGAWGSGSGPRNHDTSGNTQKRPSANANNENNANTDGKATSPSSPVVALDASGAPIPELKHLPAEFVKEVYDQLGNDVAFHVTKPHNSRIYFTFRDEDISASTKSHHSKILTELTSRYDLEYGGNIKWSEALKMVQAKAPVSAPSGSGDGDPPHVAPTHSERGGRGGYRGRRGGWRGDSRPH
ncbi:hypothetical protein HDV05_005761 [Chytridiales sp. JEL 0842]|nr:hypothetical protein HDV05_005761 [Chytridiales sp. JEL 0842]